MKKIRVEEATPGLKLARPIENESGMVLYGVGVELTGQSIERIKSLGIENVFVEGQGALRLTREAYAEVVNRAFSKVSSPLMSQFKKIMKKHMESLYSDGSNS